MRLRSEEITELPIRGVLFLKKWQSNGYYPMEIAERTSDGWITYCTKGGRKCGVTSYTNREFLYKLQNNLYLLSDAPMKNTNEFNFE